MKNNVNQSGLRLEQLNLVTDLFRYMYIYKGISFFLNFFISWKYNVSIIFK